jgi:hypothetical protein
MQTLGDGSFTIFNLAIFLFVAAIYYEIINP